MRRRMKLLTMALSSLLCSVPLCTSASVASGSLLATMGACTSNAGSVVLTRQSRKACLKDHHAACRTSKKLGMQRGPITS